MSEIPLRPQTSDLRSQTSDPIWPPSGKGGRYLQDKWQTAPRQVQDNSHSSSTFLPDFFGLPLRILREKYHISCTVVRDLFGKTPHLFGNCSGNVREKGLFFGNSSAAVEQFCKNSERNAGKWWIFGLSCLPSVCHLSFFSLVAG